MDFGDLFLGDEQNLNPIVLSWTETGEKQPNKPCEEATEFPSFKCGWLMLSAVVLRPRDL
jgi:hypothetical protein